MRKEETAFKGNISASPKLTNDERPFVFYLTNILYPQGSILRESAKGKVVLVPEK
jgi:hypothetical protein